MVDFRSNDPVFAPNANVQYELDANDYLDRYNITVDQYHDLNQRWRENANFFRDILVKNAIFDFENQTQRLATERDSSQAIINEVESLGYNKSQMEEYKGLFSPMIRFLNSSDSKVDTRLLKPKEDFPNMNRGYFLIRDAKKSEGIANAFIKVTEKRRYQQLHQQYAERQQQQRQQRQQLQQIQPQQQRLSSSRGRNKKTKTNNVTMRFNRSQGSQKNHRRR